MCNFPDWTGFVVFVALIAIPATVLLWRRQTIVRDCKHDWVKVSEVLRGEEIGRHSKCLNCGVKR